MDEATFKYLVDNQANWREQYIQQQKTQRRVKRILCCQYNESRNKNYSKEKIKNELIKLLGIEEDDIKESKQGYFYIDNCFSIRF